jgi:hypothetical protein
VRDGHREHPSDAAGEGDEAAIGCTHCGPPVHSDVDAPMSAVAANRSKVAHHRAEYRRRKTYTVGKRPEAREGGGEDKDGGAYGVCLSATAHVTP